MPHVHFIDFQSFREKFLFFLSMEQRKWTLYHKMTLWTYNITIIFYFLGEIFIKKGYNIWLITPSHKFSQRKRRVVSKRLLMGRSTKRIVLHVEFLAKDIAIVSLWESNNGVYWKEEVVIHVVSLLLYYLSLLCVSILIGKSIYYTVLCSFEDNNWLLLSCRVALLDKQLCCLTRGILSSML